MKPTRARQGEEVVWIHWFEDEIHPYGFLADHVIRLADTSVSIQPVSEHGLPRGRVARVPSLAIALERLGWQLWPVG